MFVGMPVRDAIRPETSDAIWGVLRRFGGTFGRVQDCPWIDIARSGLIAQFLATDETELLWVDADIWFSVNLIDMMQAAKSDIITAPYRKRKPPYHWCVRTLNAEHPTQAPIRTVNSARVIEIESDGLGCCLVQRRVIEALCVRHPELEYVDDNGGKRYWIFQPYIHIDNGRRLPACEDKAFFLRARAAGFRAEALVDGTVIHDGVVGRFADVFTEEAS